MNCLSRRPLKGQDVRRRGRRVITLTVGLEGRHKGSVLTKTSNGSLFIYGHKTHNNKVGTKDHYMRVIHTMAYNENYGLYAKGKILRQPFLYT